MKHGLKLRKLQRTPSHRWALLRNLVSALLHHESIKTTLPKAKEAARLAEKIITLGKKDTNASRSAATAFLMPSHSYGPSHEPIRVAPPRPTGYPSLPSSSSASSSSSSSSSSSTDPEAFIPPTSLLPKLFSTLAQRYATRPGGYTRIHKFGRRPGDNAPHAILELVDGPKDLKFEMVARAVGRETAQARAGMTRAVEVVGPDGRTREWTGLREGTQLGLNKVLKYRGAKGERELRKKAEEWRETLQAGEVAGHRRLRPALAERTPYELSHTAKPFVGHRQAAGERLSGMDVANTGLGIARGSLGKIGRMPVDRTPRFLGERTRGSGSEASA